MKKTHKKQADHSLNNSDVSASNILSLDLFKGNLIIYAVAVIIIVISGVFLGQSVWENQKLKQMQTKVIPEAVHKVVRDNKLKFTVKSVEKTSGVYRFTLDIGGKIYTSYITTDGKILFTSGIVLKNIDAKKTQTPPTPKVKKQEKKKK